MSGAIVAITKKVVIFAGILTNSSLLSPNNLVIQLAETEAMSGQEPSVGAASETPAQVAVTDIPAMKEAAKEVMETISSEVNGNTGNKVNGGGGEASKLQNGKVEENGRDQEEAVEEVTGHGDGNGGEKVTQNGVVHEEEEEDHKKEGEEESNGSSTEKEADSKEKEVEDDQTEDKEKEEKDEEKTAPAKACPTAPRKCSGIPFPSSKRSARSISSAATAWWKASSSSALSSYH